MGKVVVMGRKTFASIGNKPLPGRKCIVISTNDLHGLSVRAKTIEDALSVDHCYPELVVIGGASVYNQCIGQASKLVITHIDADFTADTFFPKIDPTIWMINSSVDSSNEHYQYKFVEYIRNESYRISD